MSSTMRAVVVQKDFSSVKVEQRPIPTPKDDQVLVKIVTLGQNPTDEKHAAGVGKENTIIGCDAAGTIAKLGSSVPSSSNLKEGTRVVFFTRGGKQENHGAFAEYVAMSWDQCMILPEAMSFEEAVTIPIPFFTAVQALFLRLKLNEPTPDKSLPLKSNGEWLLVWSGASSVGQNAVQLGHLAGYKIVTTASEANHQLLKSYGADAIFDYKDPKVDEKIREVTDNKLQYAMDCVISEDSPSLIAKSFGSNGGTVVVILPTSEDKLPRKDVKVIETLLYTALDGKDASFATWNVKAGPNDREHYVDWMKHATKLYGQGLVKPLPIEKAGGMDDVQKGFERMRDGKVKAQKLVYTV